MTTVVMQGRKRELASSNGGYSLFVTALVMVVASAFFVSCRVGSRTRAGEFGWDDALVVLALICSILLTTLIDLAVVHGYGRHSSNLTSSERATAFRWFFIAQVFYKLALGFTKLSIVLLYRRIFITKAFQRAAYVFIAAIVCWTIGTIVATILQCLPIRSAWDESVSGEKCINKDAFWYAFAATNTATDIAIFLLPIYPVLRLHLPWREKIGLLFIFAIGAFVCATSIIRTVAVTGTTDRSMDKSHDFLPRSIWTLIEANMGIICACLPMMRHYLQCCLPRRPNHSRRRTSNANGPPVDGPYVLDERLGEHSATRDSLHPSFGQTHRAHPAGSSEEKLVNG